jgi:uncharacterized protein (TIGR02246 family)
MGQPNLEDYVAITAVKARYCRFLDTKDWDAYADLFTEDFVLDSVPGQEPIRGRDAAMKSIRSFVGPAQTAHQVHSPEIDVNGDEAAVIWAMQDRVIGAVGIDEAAHTGFGHYYERYVRQGGRWRIASLKLRYVIFEREPKA